MYVHTCLYFVCLCMECCSVYAIYCSLAIQDDARSVGPKKIKIPSALMKHGNLMRK